MHFANHLSKGVCADVGVCILETISLTGKAPIRQEAAAVQRIENETGRTYQRGERVRGLAQVVCIDQTSVGVECIGDGFNDVSMRRLANRQGVQTPPSHCRVTPILGEDIGCAPARGQPTCPCSRKAHKRRNTEVLRRHAAGSATVNHASRRRDADKSASI